MPPSTKTPRASPSNRRIRATNLDPSTFAPFGQVVQNPDTHDGKPVLGQASANQGSATKWLEVTEMRSWYERARSGKAARSVMNMFVCRPRTLREAHGVGKLFDVRILERHPFTPQTFVPMGLGREEVGTFYLVVVAPTLLDSSQIDGQPSKRNLGDMLLGAHNIPVTNDPVTSTPSSSDDGGSQLKGTGLPDLENLKAFVARGDQAVTYGPGTWHAPMVVLGEEAIEFVVMQYANGVAEEDCQEVEIDAGIVSVHIGSEGDKLKARL